MPPAPGQRRKFDLTTNWPNQNSRRSPLRRSSSQCSAVVVCGGTAWTARCFAASWTRWEASGRTCAKVRMCTQLWGGHRRHERLGRPSGCCAPSPWIRSIESGPAEALWFLVVGRPAHASQWTCEHRATKLRLFDPHNLRLSAMRADIACSSAASSNSRQSASMCNALQSHLVRETPP